jgi:hypothetical protein
MLLRVGMPLCNVKIRPLHPCSSTMGSAPPSSPAKARRRPARPPRRPRSACGCGAGDDAVFSAAHSRYGATKDTTQLIVACFTSRLHSAAEARMEATRQRAAEQVPHDAHRSHSDYHRDQVLSGGRPSSWRTRRSWWGCRRRGRRRSSQLNRIRTDGRLTESVTVSQVSTSSQRIVLWCRWRPTRWRARSGPRRRSAERCAARRARGPTDR